MLELKAKPINHFPLHVLIEFGKAVCFFADTSFVVTNEECEVKPKGILNHGLDCFKFSLAEIMFVLHNKHSVGKFAVVVDEVKCDRAFAVFVRVSVFVLLHHGGGEGLRSWYNSLAINISPLAEMIICVAVTSRNVFVIGYCFYVSNRLGDRLLIYRTEI